MLAKDIRVKCQLSKTTDFVHSYEKDGKALISKDGKLICDFVDLQETGKFNVTLIVNNEDMKDRV